MLTWGHLDIPAPASVPNAVSLAAGFDSLVALTSHGTVIGWAETDTYGQLIPPSGLTGVAALALGRGHAVVLPRVPSLLINRTGW